MPKNNSIGYKLPPLSLLDDFVNDQLIVEEAYADQDEICAFISKYFADREFVCNILGVDYGFNVTEYKIQLLSNREKDDGFTYKNLFDKRKFYLEFIRKIFDFAPARTSSIKIINDNDAPMEIVLSVSVPNAFVRSIPLKHHLKANLTAFNCFFACDNHGNPITFNCDGGLTLFAGTEKDKLSQVLKTTVSGLAFKYLPSELNIIAFDTTSSLVVFNGIPHFKFKSNINKAHAFYQLLQWIKGDYERLEKLFKVTSCEDFAQYNINNQAKIARKVVIIGDYVQLQREYGVFIQECNAELKQLIKLSKKYGYTFLMFANLEQNYPLFDLEEVITNKIMFRTATEALSLLSMNNADAHWLMSSNDAIDCGKGERIIPCYISDFELCALCDFLKTNYECSFDLNSHDAILKGSESGYMSADFREENLENTQIIECVRLAIKEGYVMPSSLYNYFAIDTQSGSKIIEICVKMGYLQSSVLPDALYPAITKEQFEKIFNQKF